MLPGSLGAAFPAAEAELPGCRAPAPHAAADAALLLPAIIISLLERTSPSC